MKNRLARSFVPPGVVDGLAHTWAQSGRIAGLRRSIAEWFKTAPT